MILDRKLGRCILYAREELALREAESAEGLASFYLKQQVDALHEMIDTLEEIRSQFFSISYPDETFPEV